MPKQRIRFISYTSITMYSKEQTLYQENEQLHKLVHRQGQVIAEKTREINALQITIECLKEELQEERNIRNVLYQPKEEDGKTKRKGHGHD